jgi:hypothetical protein
MDASGLEFDIRFAVVGVVVANMVRLVVTVQYWTRKTMDPEDVRLPRGLVKTVQRTLMGQVDAS